jgi:isoaspartyl peptidase/L-asparaginase-like protein (Ntn-hydrolase superfamily)
VLTRDGHHELEASIMTSGGRCGAATLLRHTRYPISLARGVMEHSPHVLLSGAPAEELGR